MFENSSAVSGLCWTVQTSMSLQHCTLHTSGSSSHTHLRFQSMLDANLIQSGDSHDQKHAVKHAVLLLGPVFPCQGQRTAGRDSWSLSAITALLRAEAIRAQAVAKGDPPLQIILRYWQKPDRSYAAAAFYPGAPNQDEFPSCCAWKPFTILQQAARTP